MKRLHFKSQYLLATTLSFLSYNLSHAADINEAFYGSVTGGAPCGNVRDTSYDTRKMRASPKMQVSSSLIQRSAKIFAENTYLWKIVPHSYSPIAEPPRPYEGTSGLSYAPLSIYNNWPEPQEVRNRSIFEFLLLPDANTPNGAFYQFVKDWYQCACAIIYQRDSGDPSIIGSGVLVSDDYVITARHNFNNIPLERLFVRFFHYDVARMQNPKYLKIAESYLDIPVIKTKAADGGLDAGVLQLQRPPDVGIFNRFAKQLPIDQGKNALDTTPIGHYVMFHFAGSYPQVSIGEVLGPRIGSRLYSEIAIQGGPGASGAPVVRTLFGGRKAIGEGISIYRAVGNNGNVDRQIITFSEILQGRPTWSNYVRTPYRTDPNFYVIPSDRLEESGYEYIRWNPARHIGRRNSHEASEFERPNADVYKHETKYQGTHSNHHIIPIDDLGFLWDYLHVVEPTAEIIAQVRLEVAAHKVHKKTFNSRARVMELARAEYNNHIAQVNRLTPNLNGLEGTRKGFVWSWWNLFKGWNGDYRLDDPAKNAEYRETVCPSSFSPNLWAHVQELYSVIQVLKKAPNRDLTLEDSLLHALGSLADEWDTVYKESRGSRRKYTKIHPFNENDWDHMGQKNGHYVYRIKPS